MTTKYRNLRWSAILLPLLLTLLTAAPIITHAAEQRIMTAMTQNLYFGSEYTPALNATNQQEFLLGIATIYATVQFTDFPTRAEAIADEIASNHPDIIGLQEVMKITTVDSIAETSKTDDYLNILMNKLSAHGLSYSVAAVAHEGELGPMPLVQPCSGTNVGDCWVSVEDSEVILVNDTAPLHVLDSQSGRYASQHVFETIAGPITFDRGWVYIDATFQGKKFRFVNTHLDEEEYPDSQEAQTAELLSGPAKAGGAVIAVGDFNSAADGSNTKSYALLTKSYFNDSWDTNPGVLGYTWGQNDTLSNPTSLLHERIDFILTHAASRALDAKIIGDTTIGSAPPFWSSDHAGVVSTIRIH